MEILILLPLVLSLVFGIITFKIPEKRVLSATIVFSTIISISTVVILHLFYNAEIEVVQLTRFFNISFKVDGLSVIFAGLVSFLWPFATIYGKDYLAHAVRKASYCGFYTLTFGVVLGIALARNIFTIYLFYEMLTFITLPLVICNRGERDYHAGRKYIVYSLCGAAIALMGIILLTYHSMSLEFVLGGSTAIISQTRLELGYLLMFIGFSFKAAMFPFHGWLISAGVAPTTTTALLHAVAVVKSGVFAIIRITFYLVPVTRIDGGLVQFIILIMASVSIVYGSIMAMRSKHLKRRFAYSTASQLSYIILAVGTMSGLGLIAACMHMVFHALAKIAIFYMCGTVMHNAGGEYVKDVEGLSKKLNITFITFAISSFSLMGIPLLGGFFSKFAIASAAIDGADFLAPIAIAALIASALFTAIYTFQIISLSFVVHNDFDKSKLSSVSKESMLIKLPIAAIVIALIVLSLLANNLYAFFEQLLMGGAL